MTSRQRSDRLTLRSIPPSLRARWSARPPGRGESLNGTVLALLEQCLGLASARAAQEHDDLDELAGTWSKSEASRFDEALRAQRQVDGKLWR